MTTTTPSPTRNRAASRRRGFTLVEVMIAAALSTFVLTAIMTTFLFMGRSGVNLQNYSDMEAQGRRALERFAEDVRQASAISYTTASHITLTVNGAAVQYKYDSTTQIFSRISGTTTTNLITKIVVGSFAFKAYNVLGTELALVTAANLTAAGTNTKQLQISLQASRTDKTVAQATNLVLSARYILRNKIVTV